MFPKFDLFREITFYQLENAFENYVKSSIK